MRGPPRSCSPARRTRRTFSTGSSSIRPGRVPRREDLPPLEVTAAAVRAARSVVAGLPHPAAPASAEPTPASIVEPAGVGALLARVAALLAPVDADDLERLRAELASVTAELERARDQLRTLASLKHALEA